MEKEKYIGSVRFFKHLYITVLALMVLIPTGFAIGNRIALNQALDKLNAYESPVAEVVPTVDEKSAPEGELTAREIMDNAQIVAHGFGSAEGVETLNCLEGFLEQYEAGVRVFEADIRLTSDGRAVLRHDWRGQLQKGVSETSIPTLEAFLELPINGEYTPLSFSDLLLLMEQYPDICVITDTKFANEEEVTYEFNQLLNDAKNLGLTYLFGRMVIQLYTQKMYEVVDNLYQFPNYIYTLYYEGFGGTDESLRQKADFCQQNGIMGITMWDYWWNDSFYEIAAWRNVEVYLHTVNDAEEAKSFLSRGVSAIYTDTLTPADILY